MCILRLVVTTLTIGILLSAIIINHNAKLPVSIHCVLCLLKNIYMNIVYMFILGVQSVQNHIYRIKRHFSSLQSYILALIRCASVL